MGRGRRGFIDNLAALPWPVGLCAGGVGYLAVAHGIPLLFARSSAMAGAFLDFNPFLPLAWVFLGLCVIAAGMSFFRARHTRRLLDTRTGLDSMAAPGWRDFEWLVGEAFRRRGYAVEETGLDGADGGIDLVLRRRARRILVQCKQWRRECVPVSVVREMYGLLAHHGANEVRIVALGGFTPDAARFAEGMPAKVEPVLGTEGMQISSAPSRPRCDTPMMRRNNRHTGGGDFGGARRFLCAGGRNEGGAGLLRDLIFIDRSVHGLVCA